MQERKTRGGRTSKHRSNTVHLEVQAGVGVWEVRATIDLWRPTRCRRAACQVGLPGLLSLPTCSPPQLRGERFYWLKTVSSVGVCDLIAFTKR